MGIPKVKWANIVKIDHIIVQEGLIESVDAILAWGYPCLLCKVDEFFKVFKKNFDQKWRILQIKVGIPKVKWAKNIKVDHIMVKKGVLESADPILAWGYPFLLCKLDEYFRSFQEELWSKLMNFLIKSGYPQG